MGGGGGVKREGGADGGNRTRQPGIKYICFLMCQISIDGSYLPCQNPAMLKINYSTVCDDTTHTHTHTCRPHKQRGQGCFCTAATHRHLKGRVCARTRTHTHTHGNACWVGALCLFPDVKGSSRETKTRKNGSFEDLILATRKTLFHYHGGKKQRDNDRIHLTL